MTRRRKEEESDKEEEEHKKRLFSASHFFSSVYLAEVFKINIGDRNMELYSFIISLGTDEVRSQLI